MPSEQAIARMTDIFTDVIDLGGVEERTTIVPNLSVIDAAPTGLTNFIVIQDDRDGDNILAKTVPGVVYANNDKVNVLFVRGTEPIAFQQGSESTNASLWQIVPSTSTDIFYNNGDVAIGTTDPEALLHVSGGDFLLDNNQGILFKDSDGTARTIFTIDGSDVIFVGPSGSPATTSAIKFRPGSATKMTIDEGGDVGIGIETMLATLHVRGDDTDRGYLALETSDGTITSGEVISGIKFISGDDSTPAPTDKIVAKIEAIAVANHFASNFDTGLMFFTNDGTTIDERVRIDEAGRLGVGEKSPAAQLHVDQGRTTAAIPVAYFDQADVSEEMFEFNTTIGVGNAIEAVGAKVLTTTHFIKVTLPGALTRYFPVGTIA